MQWYHRRYQQSCALMILTYFVPNPLCGRLLLPPDVRSVPIELFNFDCVCHLALPFAALIWIG
jgi:hypothetical protein